MSRSRRTDLIPDIYARSKPEDPIHRIIIILFEPEPSNTTVEICVFFSIGQILSRFKKDSEWLVNEKHGNDVISEIMQFDFLPMRSSLPPRFAYGSALEDLEELADYYEAKAKELEKKLNGTADEDDTNNEPRQLTAPKDPKSRPN